MADLDISEHRLAQYGRINFRHFGPVDLELRVVVVPTRDGLEDVVMRSLTTREPLPITQRGLNDAVLAGLRMLVQKTHGLILHWRLAALLVDVHAKAADGVGRGALSNRRSRPSPSYPCRLCYEKL